MCVDRLLISRHRQIKARVSYVQRERQRLKVFEDGRVSGSIRSVSFDPDTQAVCVCVLCSFVPPSDRDSGIRIEGERSGSVQTISAMASIERSLTVGPMALSARVTSPIAADHHRHHPSPLLAMNHISSSA
jgi:hypothetical protein